MTVSDESVLKELERISNILQLAYKESTDYKCDSYLSQAIGKLGALLNILKANK
ncbi:hypothetical protein [Clostridium sp. HBUAS56010]|uniref:hypothetical protein n=1 Tax=Clostridium sp. HBUAS56010 TaxID=2571127 RepID=UPI00163D4F87|nr:hypothetical protein [Clostridium sp. HBUAS56010]